MKTLYMMRGLPASGKTTKAKQMLSDFGSGNAKRTSKDDLRAMLDGGKWSHANEKYLLGVRDYIVGSALNAGKHVIVDDTNLATKHQEALAALAKKHSAAFDVVDFTHVSVDECIDRDRKRANYVGEKVIRDMHAQFLAAPVLPAPIDPALPWCMIVDIDGTVARMNGRGPFEWARVGEDLPNLSVCELVGRIASDPREQYEQVIFVSGRDECCRRETCEWIRTVFGVTFPLHMRPEGDQRDDRIVKEEIYRREILGRYNVRFVLDDRNKVVRKWRELGLPCFQVAEGNF